MNLTQGVALGFDVGPLQGDARAQFEANDSRFRLKAELPREASVYGRYHRYTSQVTILLSLFFWPHSSLLT